MNLPDRTSIFFVISLLACFMVFPDTVFGQKVRDLKIRVTRFDNSHLVGRLSTSTDSTIEVGPLKNDDPADMATTPTVVLLNSIKTVEFKRKNSFLPGFFVGAGLGVLIAAISAPKQPRCDPSTLGGAACTLEFETRKLGRELTIFSFSSFAGGLVSSIYRSHTVLGRKHEMRRLNERMAQLRIRRSRS